MAGVVDEYYRNYRIRIEARTGWSAVITELSTGAELPTKATALRDEGPAEVLRRARQLVDVYVGASTLGHGRAA